MSKIKYYKAGMFLGEEIYLERGMKLNWTTKIPLFVKIKITWLYNILVPRHIRT